MKQCSLGETLVKQLYLQMSPKIPKKMRKTLPMVESVTKYDQMSRTPSKLEVPSGFEPLYKVLQTSA